MPIQPPLLRTLLYRSRATRPMRTPDLDRILEGSRRRNGEARVTGVLLFADGRFMQYLEGPERGIETIFDLIKTSPLHHEINESPPTYIAERQYPDWAMAYVSSDVISGLPMAFDALPASPAGGNDAGAGAERAQLLSFLKH